MFMHRLTILLSLYLPFAVGIYAPAGDEVQPGSVLLPATRRGRYLANIVRRQAVDGTGIKYNKDADRINAESKKKVDVLSDELLPYIIAEQERRTTLYKRIMTAIQNGEKGVTIAEIRNKPPLIIRKGFMFRCPSNRAPKEPDGMGMPLCEDNIEPKQVIYDSCLSAEDKELFVAKDKYFFCNRHRVEGPDLPRNESSVIGCAPAERTSLKYTMTKCALEDSDDVVVHYRYYPDNTYRYVKELDLAHEVCDHWNPCQIGYIFALPSPDTASVANELWSGASDSEAQENISASERIKWRVNATRRTYDSLMEYVHPDTFDYESSTRRVKIPDGWKYEKLWATRDSDSFSWDPDEIQGDKWNSDVSKRKSSAKSAHNVKLQDSTVDIQLRFPEKFEDMYYSNYYAVFSKMPEPPSSQNNYKAEKFVTLKKGTAKVSSETVEAMVGTTKDNSNIELKCPLCQLQGVMVRSPSGRVYFLEQDNYKAVNSKKQLSLVISHKELKPWSYGDYFAIFQNAEGNEERVKVMALVAIEGETLEASLKPTERYNATYKYDFKQNGKRRRSKKFGDEDYTLKDVILNGESAVKRGIIKINPYAKTADILIPSFDDSYAGVYMGQFLFQNRNFQKIILIVDHDSAVVKKVEKISRPQYGTPFSHTVDFECPDGCEVSNITINGMQLQPAATRRSGGPYGYFTVIKLTIIIRLPEFSVMFVGVYQAVFNVGGLSITKSIFQITSTTNATSSNSPDVADSKESEGASDSEAQENISASERINTRRTSEEENFRETDGFDDATASGAEGESAAEGDEDTESGAEKEEPAEAETESTVDPDANTISASEETDATTELAESTEAPATNEAEPTEAPESLIINNDRCDKSDVSPCTTVAGKVLLALIEGYTPTAKDPDSPVEKIMLETLQQSEYESELSLQSEAIKLKKPSLDFGKLATCTFTALSTEDADGLDLITAAMTCPLHVKFSECQSDTESESCIVIWPGTQLTMKVNMKAEETDGTFYWKYQSIGEVNMEFSTEESAAADSSDPKITALTTDELKDEAVKTYLITYLQQPFDAAFKEISRYLENEKVFKEPETDGNDNSPRTEEEEPSAAQEQPIEGGDESIIEKEEPAKAD